MSVVKHFIEDSIKKAEIDEFLRNEFERAGYGGVGITKTPLGTHLVIYTMRPGLVIGRGGETIRALATVLEEKFQLPSPQISVAEIEVPELNAHVVASKIASALKRGIHYRRAGFWGLNQAMEAGALGIEIKISGKLRTDRARYEKFRIGYLPKSGEPPRKYMRKAELHVQMKPGMLGVKVRLMPPDAVFPDQQKVEVFDRKVESEPTKEVVKAEVPVDVETPTEEKEVKKVPEPAVSPVEAKVVPEAKITEPEVPVTKEKIVEAKVASTNAKAVTEEKVVNKKVAKTKVTSVDKKVAEAKVPVVAKKPVAAKKVEKVAEPAVSPVNEKKVVKAKTASVEEKVVTAKKVAKSKAPAVAKKTAEAKKATPKVVKPKAVPVTDKKVVKKEKAAEPKAAPAKEKKTPTKKVAKAKAPTQEKDKAGK